MTAIENLNGSDLSVPNSAQKSSLISRNVSVLGHRTSVRLEPEMWSALKDIAQREGCTIHDLCSLVAKRKRMQSSLTAAVRVFVMLCFRAAATEEGHTRAGHGAIARMIERARVDHRIQRDGRRGVAEDQEMFVAEYGLLSMAG